MGHLLARGRTRGLGAAVGGVLMAMLLLGGGATAARAGGPHVGAIVMTTQAGYAAWRPSSGVLPTSRASSFPRGTARIWFYFTILHGVAHETTWQLRLRSPLGRSANGPVETTAYVNSIHFFPFDFDRSATPGVWRVYVLVDGAVLRSRSFTLR